MLYHELEFKDIYDTFQPKIYRYLTRLVGAHEAEDLTHEVFLKVNKALKTFRGESQLSTWIYRIATNAALDKLRSPSFQCLIQKRLSVDSIGEGEENKKVCLREKSISVEQQLIRTEMNECIRDFIENLPEDYRIVLVLSNLEGFKNREIAEILGITLDTVKIRLHRARAKLRAKLESNCSFYRDERNELVCDLKNAFKEFQKEY